MTHASAPRQGMSLRRKVMTGAAIGVLAVGFWLGTLFNGFGLGTSKQGGSEDDADAGGTPVDIAGENVSVDLGQPSAMRPQTSGDTASDEPLRMIAVLVKGDGYGVLKNPPANASTLAPPLSQHFLPAPLDEVVSLAQQAAGNASGVKVQIVKHKSSTVGGDSDLRGALKDAALPDGSIHVYTGFHD